MQSAEAWRLAGSFVLAALICGGAIAALRPLWRNYALARPNARSSHTQPTPQGGGIAVLLGMACALVLAPPNSELYGVFALVLLMGVLGALDDIRTLAAPPRLIVQAAIVIGVIALLPGDLRALPVLPWWIERALLAIGLLWFVNLTNFMDGIDWITAAEIVPITAALAVFGFAGALPAGVGVSAAALCGALVGFAPFNKPVARLFLGDVGSLPIGLLTGWMLIRFGEHHIAAAILLPLYYIADATITLLRGLARGEPVMQAHRRHFYQQAVDGRFTVPQAVARIALLNAVLIALAALCVLVPVMWIHIVALLAGCAAVAAVLIHFGNAKA
jgi:UDP-N-acetylmuramyl pentapeptide phosphotransferase/UDP-N-acetylglucosamine-1-phosphate transferase